MKYCIEYDDKWVSEQKWICRYSEQYVKHRKKVVSRIMRDYFSFSAASFSRMCQHAKYIQVVRIDNELTTSGL